MHFQISVFFEATFTDSRVNNLVRVGTRHSVITALGTSQTIYVTSHMKPNKIIRLKILSTFEDKQRGWQ